MRRAVIDDRVGSLGGFAPAATGWRSFTPLVGPDNVATGALFPLLASESHLWSYGCAGSSYTFCGSIISSGRLADTAMRSVFTILYGSYFGDWDNDDNMLRAPLAAAGDALVCFWAGRPTWHLHHMALGYPIGYSTRLTQNNFNQHAPGEGSRQIHIALMGDPTLRMHVVAPVEELMTAASPGADREVGLSWRASPDDEVRGYYVYRSRTHDGPFERLGGLVAGTTFTDAAPLAGDSLYMVRAVKLETGPSGSYLNLSCGTIAPAPRGPGPRRSGGRVGGI